ncbi:ABC transporter permease [Kribbella jiaozuonensis]|uniref:ABC transporter permease n=1 Tax=Kribbella jiaozuonensis TaxID=2575441 RepID=UPI001F3942EE|nr:hypothetical protein [Kribbella jiaozuonensis]
MKSLAGTGGLIRLILRRDRIVLPLWIVLLVAISVSYVKEYGDLFPTPDSRIKYASNAGFITLYGELSGSSLGEFVTWRLGFVPVMVGLISLLTVIRHTRVEEETGRRELLGATVIGRHAQLAAALITVFGANLTLAVLLALGMHSQDLPVAGSVAIGMVYAGTGWFFAAVGAVAAQLTASAGTARGIAIGVLGASYVLRAAGDTSAHTDGPLAWLSYLSPIGWAQQIHPYAENRWWLAAVLLVATIGLVVTAVILATKRDIGAGLLPDKLGPADGTLGSPFALAWRLHRGLLLAWTVGFALLGLLFGGVAKGVGDMMKDDPTIQEMFQRMGGSAGLIDSFLAGVMTLVGSPRRTPYRQHCGCAWRRAAGGPSPCWRPRRVVGSGPRAISSSACSGRRSRCWRLVWPKGLRTASRSAMWADRSRDSSVQRWRNSRRYGCWPRLRSRSSDSSRRPR